MLGILFSFQYIVCISKYLFKIRFVRGAETVSFIENPDMSIQNVSDFDEERKNKESEEYYNNYYKKYRLEIFEIVVFLEFEGKEKEIKETLRNISRELIVFSGVIGLFNTLTILIKHKTNGSSVLKYSKFEKFEISQTSYEIFCKNEPPLLPYINENLKEDDISPVWTFLYENCMNNTILIHGYTNDIDSGENLWIQYHTRFGEIESNYNKNNIRISLIVYKEKYNYDTILFPKNNNLIYDTSVQSSLFDKCYFNTLYSSLVIFFNLYSNNIETNIIQIKKNEIQETIILYAAGDNNIQNIKHKFNTFTKIYANCYGIRQMIRNRMLILLKELLFLDTKNIYLYSKILNKFIELETNEIIYYSNNRKMADINILRDMIINTFLFKYDRILSIIEVQKDNTMGLKGYILENTDIKIKFLRLKVCNFSFYHWERFETHCDKYAIEMMQEKIKGIELLNITSKKQVLTDEDGFFYIPTNLKPFYLFLAISKALCYDFSPTIKTLIIISALCLESEHNVLRERAEIFIQENMILLSNTNYFNCIKIEFLMFIVKYRKFYHEKMYFCVLETIKYITLIKFISAYGENRIMIDYFDHYKRLFNDSEVYLYYCVTRKAESKILSEEMIIVSNEIIEYYDFTKILITVNQSNNENNHNKKIEFYHKSNEVDTKYIKLNINNMFNSGFCCLCHKIYIKGQETNCTYCHNKFAKLTDGEYYFEIKKFEIQAKTSEVVQKIEEIFMMIYKKIESTILLLDLNFIAVDTYQKLLNVYAEFRIKFEKYLLSLLYKNSDATQLIIYIYIENLMLDISYERAKYEQEKTSLKKQMSSINDTSENDKQNSNIHESHKNGDYNIYLRCLECEKSYEFFELYTICNKKNITCLICPECIFKIYDGIKPGFSIEGSTFVCKNCSIQRDINLLSNFYARFKYFAKNTNIETFYYDKKYYICFCCNTFYEIEIDNQKSFVSKDKECLLICFDCDKKINKKDSELLILCENHFINVADNLGNKFQKNDFIFNKKKFKKSAYEIVFGPDQTKNYLHKNIVTLNDNHSVISDFNKYTKYPRISDTEFYELKNYVDNCIIKQQEGEPPMKKRKVYKIISNRYSIRM